MSTKYTTATLGAIGRPGAILNREELAEVEHLQAVTVGAMILRFGGRLDHEAYHSPFAKCIGVHSILQADINDPARNRVMEDAHRKDALSSRHLCQLAAQFDGKGYVFAANAVSAAMSGGSLTQIFTDSVNALAVAAYADAEDSTQGWTREVEVPSLRNLGRPRLRTIEGSLSQLPPGGTAEDESFSGDLESFRISRFAGRFSIDEQDLIDDNLGVLQEAPALMMRKAKRLRPDLVYSVILANPTLSSTERPLFNTTDGNRKTGAALAIDKLGAAIGAMKCLREGDANLNLMPTHLVVPPSLWVTAGVLLQQIAAVIGRDSKTPIALASDSRLENGLTDPKSGVTYSGSAASWYLASSNAPAIEVAYRQGMGKGPTIRGYALSGGRWGVGWDVAMDIGAKAIGWHGIQKNEAA